MKLPTIDTFAGQSAYHQRMAGNTLDWNAVAEAIEARRIELGITSERLAQLADVSNSTIKNLRRSERAKYSETTLWNVGRALGWTNESLERIARGEEPILLVPEPVVIRRVDNGRPVVDVLDIDARLGRADAETLNAVKAAVQAILDLAERAVRP